MAGGRAHAHAPAPRSLGGRLLCVIAAITALAGVARAVPALFVAGCGLLMCVLINQFARAKRTRWPTVPLQPLVDIVAIATVSATAIVLSRNDLLTTMPAAGLLFPLAVWGSVRVWRAMTSSTRRLPARAAADIVLSLLLGSLFVVFLVWLADTFGMSRSEMAVLRAALRTFRRSRRSAVVGVDRRVCAAGGPVPDVRALASAHGATERTVHAVAVGAGDQRVPTSADRFAYRVAGDRAGRAGRARDAHRDAATPTRGDVSSRAPAEIPSGWRKARLPADPAILRYRCHGRATAVDRPGHGD